MFVRLSTLLLIVLLASGCSTMRDWFRSDKSKASKPQELEKLADGRAVDKLWSTSLGDNQKRFGLFKRPAIDGDRVYASTDDGELIALDLEKGKKLWKVDLVEVRRKSRLLLWRKPPKDGGLSSSVAAGSGLVVVGGRNGEVIAVDAADGTTRWTTQATGEIFAAPVITDNRVIVRSSDGRTFGFDRNDGKRVWVYDRPVPTLSVRGNGTPVLAQDIVLLGYDDGTVVALRAADGVLVWEQAIVQPEGRTELDRMADVDGELQVGANSVYATSFYGQTVALDLATGRPLWNRDTGGFSGLELMADRLLLCDKNGSIWALDRSSGNSLWRQEGFARRGLTSPVLNGNLAVTGDIEGYLHWFDPNDGKLVAREKVQGSQITAPPVVTANGAVLAITAEGKLAAYRVTE